jgi:ornithine racemase
LREHEIKWTLVAKVLGGDEDVLASLLRDDALDGVHSIADARVSGLKTMKEIRPDVRTMYLKPPAVSLAEEVVRYADVSLNSSRTTIRALDREARRQGKTHDVIVMIEMGELREGVVRDNVSQLLRRNLRPRRTSTSSASGRTSAACTASSRITTSSFS